MKLAVIFSGLKLQNQISDFVAQLLPNHHSFSSHMYKTGDLEMFLINHKHVCCSICHISCEAFLNGEHTKSW